MNLSLRTQLDTKDSIAFATISIRDSLNGPIPTITVKIAQVKIAILKLNASFKSLLSTDSSKKVMLLCHHVQETKDTFIEQVATMSSLFLKKEICSVNGLRTLDL